jgi:hypothetical protein
MEPAHDEQTGLLTRTQIADRLALTLSRFSATCHVVRRSPVTSLLPPARIRLTRRRAHQARWVVKTLSLCA